MSDKHKETIEENDVGSLEDVIYDVGKAGAVEISTEPKPKTKKQIAADKAQDKLDAMVPEGTMVMCDDGEERPVTYRDTAIDNGDNRYFTGEPCRNGHMAERKVKGYVCTVCARLRQKVRHKERMAVDQEYKAKFTKKRADKHKKRYSNDPEYRQRVLDRAKDRRTKASVVRAEEKSRLKEAEEQVVTSAKAA